MSQSQDAVALPRVSAATTRGTCVTQDRVTHDRLGPRAVEVSRQRLGSIGQVVFSPDFGSLPDGIVIQPGETWNFQLWFRDGADSNTSDGLAIDFE